MMMTSVFGLIISDVRQREIYLSLFTTRVERTTTQYTNREGHSQITEFCQIVHQITDYLNRCL